MRAGSSSGEFTIFAKGNSPEQVVITGCPLCYRHKMQRECYVHFGVRNLMQPHRVLYLGTVCVSYSQHVGVVVGEQLRSTPAADTQLLVTINMSVSCI